jgi:hypothetical protein
VRSGVIEDIGLVALLVTLTAVVVPLAIERALAAGPQGRGHRTAGAGQERSGRHDGERACGAEHIGLVALLVTLTAVVVPLAIERVVRHTPARFLFRPRGAPSCRFA